jgi:signal transduction histidine kinase
MLADFIRKHEEEILRGTVERLTKQSRRPEDELLSDLTEILEDTVDAIRGGERALQDAGGAGRRHGGQRASLGYRIEEVPAGFGALCNTITELAAKLGESIDPSEYQALNLAMDAGIAGAVEEYFARTREALLREEQLSAAYLAHELRNALSGALAAWAALQEGRVGLHSRTADVLHRSLDRMRQLLMASLSQVRDTARHPLELRRLDLASLVRDVAATTVVGRGVQLEVDAPTTAEAIADERLMFSALSNIAQNAVKFSREGGTVWIRCRAVGAEVVIETQDECGGLPPGKAEELFQPFVQKGGDRSGVGLGLAIVRDVMAAHHGSVAVTDLPGQGCVFALRVPSGV